MCDANDSRYTLGKVLTSGRSRQEHQVDCATRAADMSVTLEHPAKLLRNDPNVSAGQFNEGRLLASSRRAMCNRRCNT